MMTSMLVDFPPSGFSSVHHCEATMNSLIHSANRITYESSILGDWASCDVSCASPSYCAGEFIFLAGGFKFISYFRPENFSEISRNDPI